MTDAGQLRTSAGTSILFVGDRALVHSGDRRRLFDAPADLTRFTATLMALATWGSEADAISTISEVAVVALESARRELFHLTGCGLVEAFDDDSGFSSAELWEAAGWGDAYRYHRHIRLLPMVDWADDEAIRADVALMGEYLADGDQPDPYLILPARQRSPLPSVASAAAHLLGSPRDTITNSVRPPVELTELTHVLAITFGQTGTRRLPATGLHLTKSSPSGGSRHPTEAFVLLLRDVGELVAGKYHVNVRDHSMDLLEEGDFRDAARTHLIRLEDRPSFEPVAVVVLVAVCDRSMFRYRESRSYRVLLHDAGHLLQTFAYVASALGRPTYRGYTLDEERTSTLFDLSPLRQLPLAFGCIG